MYYFYIVQSVSGRIGFGITGDPNDRNKKYTSHSGDIIKFPYLYQGLETHCKGLERSLKKQFTDKIWVVEDWKTEWYTEDVSVNYVTDLVNELIKERHLKVKLVCENFDYTTDLSKPVDL